MKELSKDTRIKRQSAKINKQKLEIKQLKDKVEKLTQEVYILSNYKIKPTKQIKLRLEDVLSLYPISRSAFLNFVKKGSITPIKVSPKIVMYDAKEINNFFTAMGKPSTKIEKKKKRKKKKKKKRKEKQKS